MWRGSRLGAAGRGEGRGGIAGGRAMQGDVITSAGPQLSVMGRDAAGGSGEGALLWRFVARLPWELWLRGIGGREDGEKGAVNGSKKREKM